MPARRARPPRTIRRDAWLIDLAAILRSAAIGATGVMLAIDLGERGVSLSAAGLVIGAGLAGTAVATIGAGLGADRIGRKRTLILLAALASLGYVALAATTRLVILLPLAFLGMLNGMGRDRGAATALEQAILPETTGPERRTWALAWYHVALDAGHAIGALGGAVPGLLASWLHLGSADAHRVTFLACAAFAASTIVPYALMSRRIEVPNAAGSAPPSPTRLDRTSRRSMIALALLFGLDSVGGGFLNSALVAYWFFKRFGMAEGEVAALFFAARVLNAASHVAAAWIARRIGLVNTMVFTHLPSSVFLMAAPAAGSAGLAGALFLAREALVEMDVPTRQSYVMAIVRPQERTLVSAVTNVSRNVAWAIGPSLAGLVMERVAFAGPIVLGGTLKIVYDLLLYRSFRHLQPPDERPRADDTPAGVGHDPARV